MGQSYSYIMRKVWYHQIWIQNCLFFIVPDLLYNAWFILLYEEVFYTSFILDIVKNILCFIDYDQLYELNNLCTHDEFRFYEMNVWFSTFISNMYVINCIYDAATYVRSIDFFLVFYAQINHVPICIFYRLIMALYMHHV